MCFSTKAEDNADARAFAKGSKVTVRTGGASGMLKAGTYTVKRADREYVYLEEITGGYWHRRFETPSAKRVVSNPGAFKGAKVADILAVLRGAMTGRTARDIAGELGANPRQVPKRMTELLDAGKVKVVRTDSKGSRVYGETGRVYA